MCVSQQYLNRGSARRSFAVVESWLAIMSVPLLPAAGYVGKNREGLNLWVGGSESGQSEEYGQDKDDQASDSETSAVVDDCADQAEHESRQQAEHG